MRQREQWRAQEERLAYGVVGEEQSTEDSGQWKKCKFSYAPEHIHTTTYTTPPPPHTLLLQKQLLHVQR
jgi:hypothetical protein